MNPLESLLIIYKDKQKVLDHYLPKETTDQLHNIIYYDKNDTLLYLNDTIFCIQKSFIIDNILLILIFNFLLVKVIVLLKSFS